MEYSWCNTYETLDMSGGPVELADLKRPPPMHDFLVAAAFLLMVVLPCIVTMGSGSTEEDEA